MKRLSRLIERIPLARGLAYSESVYHTGSVVENRMGLQIGKVLGKHFAWRLRKSEIPSEIREYVGVLDREGVLVIPNFLSGQEFALVREEFECAQSRLDFKPYRQDAGRVLQALLTITDKDEEFHHIKWNLRDNALILQLVSAIVRRPIKRKPDPKIYIHRKFNDKVPDNDVENILHADLHAPTIKVFFYLNDIDESNGAFIYAKGSHKISWGRLIHEYDMSIRTAKLRRGDRDMPSSLLETRGTLKRNTMSEESRRRMKIVETSLCGKANTLVVANNIGFHRRGEFSTDQPREKISLNFRYLERPF